MGKAEDVRLLEVCESASKEELKQAYRRCAMRCHPDVTGDQSSEEFVQVRGAYERLRDGYWEKVGLDEVPEARKPRPTQRRSSRPKRGPDFINLFDNLMQNVGDSSRRKVLDDLELEAPLDYLIFGASISIYVPIHVACRACQGRGHISDRSGVSSPCPRCKGDGGMEKQLRVPVAIPPNLRSGATLRVPCEEAGMPGYDLLITVTLGVS